MPHEDLVVSRVMRSLASCGGHDLHRYTDVSVLLTNRFSKNSSPLRRAATSTRKCGVPFSSSGSSSHTQPQPHLVAQKLKVWTVT